MSNDPNTLANRIATRTRTLTTSVLHLDATLRLHAPDGYPTRTLGSSPPSGRSRDEEHIDLTSVEAAALASGPTTRANQQMHQALDQMTRALDTIERLMAQWMPVGAGPADRCSGHIDPTCTELSAGPDYQGLCAKCIPKACRRCWRRPSEQRRSPMTGDPCCQACFRREARARGEAA